MNARATAALAAINAAHNAGKAHTEVASAVDSAARSAAYRAEAEARRAGAGAVSEAARDAEAAAEVAVVLAERALAAGDLTVDGYGAGSLFERWHSRTGAGMVRASGDDTRAVVGVVPASYALKGESRFRPGDLVLRAYSVDARGRIRPGKPIACLSVRETYDGPVIEYRIPRGWWPKGVTPESPASPLSGGPAPEQGPDTV